MLFLDNVDILPLGTIKADRKACKYIFQNIIPIKYKLFQIGCCKNKSSFSLLNGKMVLDSLNEPNNLFSIHSSNQCCNQHKNYLEQH